MWGEKEGETIHVHRSIVRKPDGSIFSKTRLDDLSTRPDWRVDPKNPMINFFCKKFIFFVKNSKNLNFFG
jgi:hypothetical protein